MERVRRHERRTRKHGIGGNRRLRSHRVKWRRRRGSRALGVLLEGVADDRDGLQDLRPPTAQPFLQRPLHEQSVQRTLRVVRSLLSTLVPVVAIGEAARTAVQLDGDAADVLMSSM